MMQRLVEGRLDSGGWEVIQEGRSRYSGSAAGVGCAGPGSDPVISQECLCPLRFVVTASLVAERTALSIRAAATSRLSCSHTRTTHQPAATKRASVSASRRLLASIFARHQSPLRLGHVACTGHPCQKQPSKKMTKRALGKTISARRCVPGISRRWTRNRNPLRCRIDRRASSRGLSR